MSMLTSKVCKECIHYSICEYSLISDKQNDCKDYIHKANYNEIKYAQWFLIETNNEMDECSCSLCGQHLKTAVGTRMKYCPNCGAKMWEGLNG